MQAQSKGNTLDIARGGCSRFARSDAPRRELSEYLREFEGRLDELEHQGWSLPVYREAILADVRRIDF